MYVWTICKKTMCISGSDTCILTFWVGSHEIIRRGQVRMWSAHPFEIYYFLKRFFCLLKHKNLYILNVFMFNVYINVLKLERSRKYSSPYINMYVCMYYVCMYMYVCINLWAYRTGIHCRIVADTRLASSYIHSLHARWSKYLISIIFFFFKKIEKIK